MAFLMKAFKFLSSLIEFDLGGLSFGYFLFELFAFVSDLDGKFLNL